MVKNRKWALSAVLRSDQYFLVRRFSPFYTIVMYSARCDLGLRSPTAIFTFTTVNCINRINVFDVSQVLFAFKHLKITVSTLSKITYFIDMP